MQAERNPGSPGRDHTIVVRGYGVAVRVEQDHLLIIDGVGADHRIRRIHRTDRPRRLLIIARSGVVSIDAVQWMRDVGVSFALVGPDGELLAASAAHGPDIPALRRAQALAADGPAGVEIARAVLGAKVRGQRELLPGLPDGTAAQGELDQAASEIERATSIEAMLAVEAAAAGRYWNAWAELPVRWPAGRSRQFRIPRHWRAFGSRSSLLTGGPRLATNPPNATANYLYSLLEAEAVAASRQAGLDPGIAIWHSDRVDRASLALDLIEGARPAVDQWLLDLLRTRTISPAWFYETERGACRITPTLTSELARTSPHWREAVAPIVEQVTHILARHSPARIPLRTPLTRERWRRSWTETTGKRTTSMMAAPALPNTCPDCGALLQDHNRRRCPCCPKPKHSSNKPSEQDVRRPPGEAPPQT